MTCEVIRDLLPLCADGVASEESRAAVEEHIRTCDVCRALYESMCAPLEVQEAPKEPDYMAAIRRQKKERRRFLLLAYGIPLGLLLLLLVGWELKNMPKIQTRYYDRTSSVTSAQVAREMPQALLTQAEKELAKVIFSLPEVQAALAENAGSPLSESELPEEVCRDLLVRAGVDPDSVKRGNAGTLGRTVYLDYFDGEYRCILRFTDNDESGCADFLKKYTKESPQVDENGVVDIRDSAPGYSAEINVAMIGSTQEDAYITYQKSVFKRGWLGFLKRD